MRNIVFCVIAGLCTGNLCAQDFVDGELLVIEPVVAAAAPDLELKVLDLTKVVARNSENIASLEKRVASIETQMVNTVAGVTRAAYEPVPLPPVYATGPLAFKAVASRVVSRVPSVSYEIDISEAAVVAAPVQRKQTTRMVRRPVVETTTRSYSMAPTQSSAGPVRRLFGGLRCVNGQCR